MKIRSSYSNKIEHEGEHGVYCPCGLCLFFDEKDLTPPETVVTCPECGFTIKYYTGFRNLSEVMKDIFNSRIDRLTKTMEEKGYKKVEEDDQFITFIKDENGIHGICRFGLWKIRNEPDVDFEMTIDRLKGV